MAIIRMAPRSSTIASPVRKTFNDIGTFLTIERIPRAKAISVAIGIPNPDL
jgi:hypothetical protein